MSLSSMATIETEINGMKMLCFRVTRLQKFLAQGFNAGGTLASSDWTNAMCEFSSLGCVHMKLSGVARVNREACTKERRDAEAVEAQKTSSIIHDSFL